MIMKNKTFHLVSLGCAKNSVDSESMAQLLMRAGYRRVDRPAPAELLIVNTCGFIGPARDESLQALGELAARKRPGQKLIAAGCLTQRYGIEIARQVAGIDGIIGARRWMDIVEMAARLRDGQPPGPVYQLLGDPPAGEQDGGVRRAAINGGSAYLKIADGCRHPCAFCAIPLIKGPAVSRPLQAVLDEAAWLDEQGVQEIILIAQDTTDYGYDLPEMADGRRVELAHLLRELVAAAPGVPWIRVLYAYPGCVTDELIETMASHPRILPYLDMPLQHAHPATLRRMRRPANIEWVYRTLEKIRLAMPELALRTTFIVGYPGETEEEFAELLEFIREIRFDRVGAFQFSFEAGTPSEPLGDPVPPEVKQERYERLMALQQGISLEKNQAWVGRKLDVLIEGCGDGLSLGRSFRDAPEIDGLVIIEEELPVGSLAPVRITGAMTYDLSGRLEAGRVEIS